MEEYKHPVRLTHPDHERTMQPRTHKYSCAAALSVLGYRNGCIDESAQHPDLTESVKEMAEEVNAGGWTPELLRSVCDAVQTAQQFRICDQEIARLWDTLNTAWGGGTEFLALAQIAGVVPRPDDYYVGEEATYWMAERPEGWAEYTVDLSREVIDP